MSGEPKCKFPTKRGGTCGRAAGWGTDHVGRGRCRDHEGLKSAPTERVCNRPRDWDKAVAAAYLRLVGLSQDEAAAGAGCGERTLARWEASIWWPEACEEAVDRWMKALTIESRKTLIQAVKDGDAERALKILERVDRRLAPPKQQHEITFDYLHRDEVAKLMRGLAEDVAEIVTDPVQREEIIRRARARIEPLFATQGGRGE